MSATATLDDATSTGPAEHFDVLIVGAGISGVGGAYHLQDPVPRQASWCSRRSRASAAPGWMHRYPGHPLRQRPLHLRLPLQALDRRADRHRRRDPQVHGRGDRRERPRSPHPLRPPGSPPRPGPPRPNLWTSTPVGPRPASRSASPATSCGCARATTATEGLHPRVARAWTASRARSSTRRPGPRTSTTRQEGHRDRLGGDHRDGRAGHRRDTAHITVLQRSPTYFWTGRNANELADMLRELEIDETWIHEIVRRKVLFDQEMVTKLAFDEPEFGEGGAAQRRPRLPAPTTTSTSTSRRSTAPGSSASRSCPTATCSRASAPGKASMVTDEIETLHREGHPAPSPARSSRPTSSSPPPASTSACSATSPSASTASRSTSPTPSPIAG
jgi:hypothetical protein